MPWQPSHRANSTTTISSVTNSVYYIIIMGVREFWPKLPIHKRGTYQRNLFGNEMGKVGNTGNFYYKIRDLVPPKAL